MGQRVWCSRNIWSFAARYFSPRRGAGGENIHLGYPRSEQRNLGVLARWRAFLLRPIDSASLALFRISFGLLMLVEVFRYVLSGWVHKYYVEPEFVFSFVSFVKPWEGSGMYWHFAGLGLLALLIAAGLYYRIAAALFFFGYIASGIRPSIYVFASASLNGRPPQMLIDPKIDLAAQPFTLRPKPWIVFLRPRATF